MPQSLFADQTCSLPLGVGGEAGGRKKGWGPDGPSPSPLSSQPPDDLPHIPNRAAWRRALRKQRHADAPPPVPPKLSKHYPRCARGRGGLFYDPDTGESRWVPFPCGTWVCPDCSDRKLGRVISKIQDGAPERHIVITKRPVPGLRFDLAWRLMRKQIYQLVVWARRIWGPMQYFLAPEPHESGAPHAHMLQKGTYIDDGSLARQWFKISGSYVLSMRRIKNTRNAIADAAKYVTKTAPILNGFPTKLAPYTFSRDWLSPEAKEARSKPSRWHYVGPVRGTPLDVIKTWQRLGADVLDDPDNPYGYIFRLTRSPPPDVLEELLTYGDSTERAVAALAQTIRPAAGAPPASIDQITDRVDYLTDDRRPF